MTEHVKYKKGIPFLIVARDKEKLEEEFSKIESPKDVYVKERHDGSYVAKGRTASSTIVDEIEEKYWEAHNPYDERFVEGLDAKFNANRLDARFLYKTDENTRYSRYPESENLVGCISIQRLETGEVNVSPLERLIFEIHKSDPDVIERITRRLMSFYEEGLLNENQSELAIRGTEKLLGILETHK